MGHHAGKSSLARRIRLEGLRVKGGPWTLCGLSGGTGRGIVALGAKAGGAVTRSRIRRIARTALRSDWALDTRLDLLLMARSEVADRPRRLVRSELTQLLSRLMEAIARIRDTQGSHA